jgi:hypothetical protein
MGKTVQQTHVVWSPWDELGLRVGIQRQTGEDNYNLQQRVLDTYTHRGGPTRQGLINSISRDLGYPTYNVVDKRYFILDYYPLIDYEVKVTIDGVEQTQQILDSSTMPKGWIYPSGTSASTPGYAETVASGVTQGWILWRTPNGEYSNILEFLEAPTSDAKVRISYTYRSGDTYYGRTDGDFTIADDETDLIYGQPGEFKGYKEQMPNASTHIQVHSLNDQTYLTDTTNGLFTSEGAATELLETIATKIRKAAPIVWGEVVSDISYWDSASSDFSGIENLPTLLDANISGYYRTSDNHYTDRKSDFQSGVGQATDLFVSPVNRTYDRPDYSPPIINRGVIY